MSVETQQYGIPAGAAIQAVSEDSPAARAGLQRGDVITAVDGETMSSSTLVNYVRQAAIGQQVVFSIYRQGETLEITVTVGEQIQSALAQKEQQQNYPSNYPWGPGRN